MGSDTFSLEEIDRVIEETRKNGYKCGVIRPVEIDGGSYYLTRRGGGFMTEDEALDWIASGKPIIGAA